MKWELDLWYELWDRAGSQGLDTWYELRKEAATGLYLVARRMRRVRMRTGPGGCLTGLGDGARRRSWRLDKVSGSAVLVVLLISEVAAVVVGAETTLFASIVAAWFVLPDVGLKYILDAGCFFMLVSLGIVVVADLARARLDPASDVAPRRRRRTTSLGTVEG